MNSVLRSSKSNRENVPPPDPNLPTDLPDAPQLPEKISTPHLPKILPRSDVSGQVSVVPSDLDSDSDSNVKVVARIRPDSDQQIEVDRIVRKVSSNVLSVGDRTFSFDSVIDSDSTQEDVFQLVGVPLVKNSLDGYNTSLLSYGQTGSGKTYTMWGPQSAMVEGQTPISYQGIVPRIFRMLFSEIQKEQEYCKKKHVNYQCRCSFLEIYNEQIADLLDPKERNLRIRDDPKNGFYVENLTEDYVNSFEDVTQILIKGLSNRKVGATSINSKSSRSHIVFTCVIESWCKGTSSKCFSSSKSSRISIIDLAGLERNKLDSAGRHCVKVGRNVKWSLSQLGNVVHALAQVPHSGESQNIPYKDSCLTHVLWESLGGNTKLTVICALSPDERYKGETLSTLRFGQQAKFIQNKAVINEITEDAVNDLSDQIRQLKEDLIQAKSNGGSSVSNSGYFRGNHTRESLNLLRLSLNHSLVLPHIENDSEEEVNIDEEDVRELCVQLGNMHSSHEELSKDMGESNDLNSPKEGPGDDENSMIIPLDKCEVEEMHFREAQKGGPTNFNLEHMGVYLDTSSPLDPPVRCTPSIVPCRPSLVLEDPTSSMSPKIVSNQKKNTAFSSNLFENQHYASESTKYSSDFLKPSVKLSDRACSSLPSSKVFSGPTESLAVSLQRGLQIIDYHQRNSASRNSPLDFSFEKLVTRSCQDVDKVEAGMQTLPEEGLPLGGPTGPFLCSSCGQIDVSGSKQVQDSLKMWMVPVVDAETPEHLKNPVPKEERVLGEALKRKKELEILCAAKEAKIEQLNCLVLQYKYEREHNSNIEQSQGREILHLKGFIDGTTTHTGELRGDMYMPLDNDCKPKQLHKRLDHEYEGTSDIKEREALFEEIQSLRNQLHSFVNPPSNDSITKHDSQTLLQSIELGKYGSVAASESSREEDLEKQRHRWTEMESEWISLTEELRLDLEAKRRLVEKAEGELKLEKKVSEELDDALHRAILGHARFIEHYAELQEKHNDLLGKHKKIMERIAEVKNAATKAGTKGAGSRFNAFLAAELSASRVERERERDYLKAQNKSLRIQLRDTAEAVHAAGELLVRLREAEEAASIMEEKYAAAKQETEKAKKQLEKLKKKHQMEISTMKQYLAESRLPESALRSVEHRHDSYRTDSRILEDDDQDWRAEFGPLYVENYPGPPTTYSSPMRTHVTNGIWNEKLSCSGFA